MTRIGYRGWCGVSAVALPALMLISPEVARADTTPDTLEEVVVTGIRASLRSSMEVKRNALQVIDAISAEDIG